MFMHSLPGAAPCRRLAACLLAAALAGSTAGCQAAAKPPPPAARRAWVEEQVSFRGGGMTVYGTLRRPAAGSARVPAALLIAGSGPTDRNGNDRLLPHMDTLRTLAQWLSDDGVASLRYDKLFSGQTGAGPYAGHEAEVGIGVFEQQAAAALRFLAAQPGIDRGRLSVAGHSEGALYALLLQSGLAGRVPPVHALVLLEPLSRRYLDTVANQLDRTITTQLRAGAISAERAQRLRATIRAAVARLRATGTLPADLPGGLSRVLSPQAARFLAEADRYDPAGLAARLPAGMPVLISCSDADIQVSCADARRMVIAAAGARTRLDAVRLHGVDHVLKEDPSRTGNNYDKPLPFSAELREALRGFVAAHR